METVEHYHTYPTSKMQIAHNKQNTHNKIDKCIMIIQKWFTYY